MRTHAPTLTLLLAGLVSSCAELDGDPEVAALPGGAPATIVPEKPPAAAPCWLDPNPPPGCVDPPEPPPPAGCSASYTTAINSLIAHNGYTGATCTSGASTILIGGFRAKECAQATVVYNPVAGCAYALSKSSAPGPIRNAWMSSVTILGAPSGALVSDGGGKYYQRVDRGVLTLRAGASTAYYLGSLDASMGLALRTKWLSVRGQAGYPTANTRGVGWNQDGVGNPLAPGAYIYVGPGGAAAHVVSGAIQSRYTGTAPFFPQRWYDAPGGALGYPTGDQVDVVESGLLIGQSFAHGSISGPVSGVLEVSADPLPLASLPALHPAPAHPGATIQFRLSSALVKPGCANDRDGDCLDQVNENQLAFLAAPRIFWDEDENTSENVDPVHWKRLDLVQVRPITSGTWASDATWKRLAIHYLMPYPLQIAGLGHTHVGDGELVIVELSSRNLRDWYLDRAIYTHHGESAIESADHLAGLAIDLGTTYPSIASDEDSHGSWPGRDADSGDCAGDGDNFWNDCFAPALTQYAPGQYRSTTLRDALAQGTYGWFDASRNIGEPESFNTDGWPSPTSGPRIALRQGGHVVYNDTGHGENYEYIEDVSLGVAAARAFCGWKCSVPRTIGGYCPDSATILEPSSSAPLTNYATQPCDDNIFYLPGDDGQGSFEARYTLWGMTRRVPVEVTP